MYQGWKLTNKWKRWIPFLGWAMLSWSLFINGCTCIVECIGCVEQGSHLPNLVTGVHCKLDMANEVSCSLAFCMSQEKSGLLFLCSSHHENLNPEYLLFCHICPCWQVMYKNKCKVVNICMECFYINNNSCLTIFV